MNFEGKTVVVTGGFGALGTAALWRLINAGADAVAVDAHDDPPDGWPLAGESRIALRGGTDLRDADQVSALYDSVDGLWASINIAGGFLFAALNDTEPSDFDRMIEMNIRTCFLSCRAASAKMQTAESSPAGRGRIVNVAARPALEPRTGANMSAYAASKAAVAALTVALGEELVSDGILVNAVAPSILDTPQNRSDMPEADHESWPALDQVAETVAFLASPSNMVTRSAVVPVYGRA